MKTAILGAGVSGLALARLLQQGGVPLADLHLFEAAAKPGGQAADTVPAAAIAVRGCKRCAPRAERHTACTLRRTYPARRSRRGR